MTLLVDIGGGRTELIFLKDGIVVKLESFNNGTLRSVKDNEAIMEKMKIYIQSNLIKGEKINVVGTGGNLRRLGKMRKKVFATGNGTSIKREEVTWFNNEIKGLTPAEITKRFDLKSDRADVIGVALRIFSTIVDEVNPEAIYLSKLGLSDSLLNKLSE
jgi:exopolyphosphatase/guanosine-5'-triphosphate,3'-diphosphate pyrophosphatase